MFKTKFLLIIVVVMALGLNEPDLELSHSVTHFEHDYMCRKYSMLTQILPLYTRNLHSVMEYLKNTVSSILITYSNHFVSLLIFMKSGLILWSDISNLTPKALQRCVKF